MSNAEDSWDDPGQEDNPATPGAVLDGFWLYSRMAREYASRLTMRQVYRWNKDLTELLREDMELPFVERRNDKLGQLQDIRETVDLIEAEPRRRRQI